MLYIFIQSSRPSYYLVIGDCTVYAHLKCHFVGDYSLMMAGCASITGPSCHRDNNMALQVSRHWENEGVVRMVCCHWKGVVLMVSCHPGRVEDV